MVNQFRTLLLNRNGSDTGFVSRLGEEFIPPKFRAVKLPTYLTVIRRVLFGNNPDWLLENYRVRQLLALLHATELVEFVTKLDPRVTYNVNNPDMLSDAAFGARDENGSDSIRFIGDQPAPDESGQAYRRWRIALVDATTVSVQQLSANQIAKEFSFTSDGTWSSPVPLGSSAFFVSFQPTANTAWTVLDLARPTRSLGEIAAGVSQVAGNRMIELFGTGTAQGETEPWKTFRNLWFDHPTLAYRLGGLLAATVYRTEERRTGA